jgi:hypothetical protein
MNEVKGVQAGQLNLNIPLIRSQVSQQFFVAIFFRVRSARYFYEGSRCATQNFQITIKKCYKTAK